MNKTDWIEYFEAINSRKPSEEEISQALAAGEFSETVVVEAVEDTTSLEKSGSVEENETVTPVDTATTVETNTEKSVVSESGVETKTAALKEKKKKLSKN